MTTSCVSHARRAVLMYRPPFADHRAHLASRCLPCRSHSDIPPRPYKRLVVAVVTFLAALIAARDSLCANSMALGGRAGDNSCKPGDVIGRLALEARADRGNLAA